MSPLETAQVLGIPGGYTQLRQLIDELSNASGRFQQGELQKLHQVMSARWEAASELRHAGLQRLLQTKVTEKDNVNIAAAPEHGLGRSQVIFRHPQPVFGMRFQLSLYSIIVP